MWATVQFPGADVRCVGFASPRVDSQAFCKPDLFRDIFTVLPAQARCGRRFSSLEQMSAAWALPVRAWASKPSASLTYVMTYHCVACAGAMWATVQFPGADVRCVGFASPRVGNKAFCKSANYLIGSSIRVEYGHDPIPGVPGRGL